MENLTIQATNSTPTVSFDTETNFLIISGKCFPENVTKFFDTVNSYVKEYLSSYKDPVLNISIKLEYINSASVKYLLDLLKDCRTSCKTLNVIWGFEEDNDDILETGEFFEDILGIHFKYVPII
jgi:hypothetical protein